MSAPHDGSGSEDFDAIEEMLDTLVDPVLEIDVEGVVQAINPAACSMFGWPREDIMGQKVNLLMGEPYRTEHDEYLRRYLSTGETHAIGRVRKVIGRRRSGEDFPAELSVSVAVRDGRPRFYGIVRDMTEREEMAARLAQVERLAAMGELAAGIAHEVNNPINTIIQCAELVKEGDDDPALLDDVVQEAMRVAVIVRDLLNFAQDNAGQRVPLDLREACERVVRMVSRRLSRQGIELQAVFDDDMPSIDAVAHQLQQVFLNLILNARDALLASDTAPERPLISVRVTHAEADAEQPSALVVRVRDNGAGIPEKVRDRIFEPFFTTKSAGQGTGLGLAVTRGIITDHGGSIAVTSEVGAFTEFEIRLPTSPRGDGEGDAD